MLGEERLVGKRRQHWEIK